MHRAATKYQNLLQKGVWSVKAPKDDHIIALTATGAVDKSEKGVATKSSGAGGGSAGHSFHKGKWAWKGIYKEGDPKNKTFEGKK